ncbi:MAG: VCBS repeat-containing protein, partial [Bacteroidales bacterium]|nr:VCBS repeat-containing protein [Bacteroidales bacterium]
MKHTLHLNLLFLVFSTIFLINKTYAQTYCSSSSSSTTIYISQVWFPTSTSPFANAINTPVANYYDGTSQGSVKTFTYTNQLGLDGNRVSFAVQLPASESGKTEYYAVYIDYNKNGSFELGEKAASGSVPIGSGGGAASTSLYITMPSGLTGGNTRMRIIVEDNTAISGPCDAGFVGETQDWTVTLPTGNSAPVLSNIETTTLSYKEGDVATQITNTITASDANNSTLASGTVSITGNFTSGQDVLSFTNTSSSTYGNIAASYNSTTGVLSLSSSGATATVAQWQAALRAVKYNNTGQDPSSSTRTVSFVVNDGTVNSTAVTRQISVTPVNDPPTLTATASNPTFTEGGSAVTLFSSATASTVESGQTITSLGLTVSNLADGTAEILGIDGSTVALTNGNTSTTSTNGLSVSVSVSGTTATVTVLKSTGVSTAAIQNIINGLTYKDTYSYATGSRTIKITSIKDNGGTANGGNNTTTTSITSTVSISISPPATGDGSAGNPYQIANLHDLFWLSNTSSVWGKSFIQTADIDASSTSGWDGGKGFKPIGNSATKFTGTYDGSRNTITGLIINRSSTSFVGLIGNASGAIIKNIGLINVDIKGSAYDGALVGMNDASSIVSNSYSTGSVSGSDNYVGGLVGDNNSSSTISDSYSMASVSSSGYYVGGLVGVNIASSKLSNSYSTGSVSGSTRYVGGLVGLNSSSTVSNSFWDQQTSGQTTSSGGSGKTTAEMKTLSTFTGAGWDFQGETANGTADIWGMNASVNSGYPFLSWQGNYSYYTPVTPSGSGTSSDPYKIANLNNLYWLSVSDTVWTANAYFIQTADINASASSGWNSGSGFSPIGSLAKPFVGSYDGQGHTIDSLYINRSTENYIGLFGYLSATVKNIGLTNVRITGNSYVGGLAGSNPYGNVSNSFTTGTVKGGLNTGGLIGSNNQMVSNVYSLAYVEGSKPNTGGLIGFNAGYGTISHAYASATITGITNVGALVGFFGGGSITASFWNSDLTSKGIGYGTSTGATGITNIEMQTDTTFTHEGWDFKGETTNGTSDTWNMNTYRNSGLPFLSWQHPSDMGKTPPSAGDGSAGNPYQIATLSDLYWLSQSPYVWSDNFIQTADIDAGATKNWDSGKGFWPIGNSTTKFSGTYNGQNHIIDSLKINRPSTSNVGFFSYLYLSAKVENLGLAHVNFTGNSYTGGIVGNLVDGTIQYCYTTGSITASDALGGIAGTMNGGRIQNCYATAEITGGSRAGALAGLSVGTVINCYAVGKVTGTSDAGTLIGVNYGTVQNSFWNTDTESPTTHAGGTGKTSAELQTKSTFTNAGWDFTNTWTIMYKINQGYPYLSWQYNAPTITSFSPVSGPVGTTDTIKGTHFNTTTTNNIVRFGATKATVTAATDTSLIVTVPDGADYRYITVTDTTSGYKAYSAQPFIVTFTQGGNFAAKVDYPTGLSPYSVTTGDFNGDGIPDLAVANTGSKSVSVFIGRSDGTFAPKVDYTTGTISKPYKVTTGDFNGDGIVDLAVVNNNSNSVSVFIGKGDGTFNNKVDYTTGTNPSGVTTGDFNGDGISDLAVANSISNTVSIMIGMGDGTFAAKVDYATGTNPTSVTTGDFNGDGIPDLAVANISSNSVSVLIGKGDGTFAPKVDYPTGSYPQSVTTGDFNGDGIPDLAVANEGPGTVSVYVGKGDGTFAAKVDYTAGSQPYSVTTGDFNGDGIVDLAVANEISNTVSVFLGKGNGTFAPKVDYTTGAYPASVTTGDFNGDGKTDLVVANEGSNTVSILDNIPFIPNITSFSPASGPVGTTDTIKGTHFNTTATNNIVRFGATKATVTTATDTSLIVTVPDGADYRYITVTDTTTGLTASSAKPFIVTFSSPSVFVPKVDFGTGHNPFSVATGDFNGDGIPDLVVPNLNNNSVSILLGQGNGSYSTKADYGTGSAPQSVAVGDFNGDGIQDLAVANNGSNTVSVLLGNGDGTFAAKVDYGTGSAPYSVTTGDFNGDGKPDLAVTNINDNTVSILLGHGDGTFAAKVDYTTGTEPNSVTTGDFNGDGKPDLALTNAGSGTVSVLLGHGDGTFAAKVDYVTGSAPYSVTTGDFNKDGYTDLAVTNRGSNNLSVLLGKGDGTFAAKVDYATGSTPFSVTTGDLNGDGKLDLAVANFSSNTVSVFTGNGDGTFNTKRDYATGGEPIGVNTVDFNGDGRTDIVVANDGDNTVSVFRNSQSIPTISSFSPTSGPVGTTDTIKGTYFNTTATNNKVYFGATKATVTAATDTTLVVTVPVGSDYRYITVTDTTTGLTASSAKPFIVTFQNGGNFARKVDYNSGTRPHGVSSGDFNGDGIPDLAVVNDNASGTVSVFLGKGDGTFKNKVAYATGSKPFSITTGDFNGDGIQDLAVPNSGSNTVSVLLGKGDGTFAAKVDYATGYSPVGVTTGDFNGDGIPDLAVVNFNASGTVSILLGKGDGTFKNKVDYATGSHSYALVTGDFNGDGIPDLAVVNNYSPGTVSVLLGKGDGTFYNKVDYATGDSPYGITTGDFNGDGKLDLAVANSNYLGTVSVLLGKGDGTFAAKVDYPASKDPWVITASDLNGDGVPDLAVVNQFSNTVSVLIGKGDGTFHAKVDYATGTWPEGLATGDFNGDGKTDLAVTNYASNTTSILDNIPFPPRGLSYQNDSVVTIYNTAITNDTATVTGIVDSMTISPVLPSGLSFNKKNGVISGTPAMASP